MATKEQLINSKEFETALIEGAEHKKDIVTSYKSQNKNNFNSFYEVMLEANQDIQKILNTKKSKRTDGEKQQLEDFKKSMRSMYNQVQALTVDEHLEAGQKTKLEKIVDKIIPVINILRYINCNKLEDEFNRRGMTLNIENICVKYPALNTDDKRTAIAGIFNTATTICQKVLDDNNYINEDIFTKKVPTDLQYDKESNNVGLKTGDWRKLVDAKAKLIMATSEEAKEKAEEKIENIAAQKQFEVARAELVRDKLTKLQ